MLSADVITNIAEFYIRCPEDRMLFLTLNKDIYEDVRRLLVRFPLVYKPGTYSEDFAPDNVTIIVPPEAHIERSDIEVVAPRLRFVSVACDQVKDLTEEMPQLKELRIVLSSDSKGTIDRRLYPNTETVTIADPRVVDPSSQTVESKYYPSMLYSFCCDKYKGDLSIIETTTKHDVGALTMTTRLQDDDGDRPIATRMIGRIMISPINEQIKDLIAWEIQGIHIRTGPALLVAPFEFGTRLRVLKLFHVGFDVDVELPPALIILHLEFTAALPTTKNYIDERFTNLRELTLVYAHIVHVHKSVADRLNDFICNHEHEFAEDDKEDYINTSKNIRISSFPNVVSFGTSLTDEFPVSPKLQRLQLFKCNIAGQLPVEYGQLKLLSMCYCPNITGPVPRGIEMLSLQDCDGIEGPLPLGSVKHCWLNNLKLTDEICVAWRPNLDISIVDCPNITGTIDMKGHEGHIEVDRSKIMVLE
jgi:hypothetical protein